MTRSVVQPKSVRLGKAQVKGGVVKIPISRRITRSNGSKITSPDQITNEVDTTKSQSDSINDKNDAQEDTFNATDSTHNTISVSDTTSQLTTSLQKNIDDDKELPNPVDEKSKESDDNESEMINGVINANVNTRELPNDSEKNSEPPSNNDNLTNTSKSINTIDQPLKPIKRRKQTQDDEIQILNIKIPLTDIISGQMIKYCTKSTKCQHISCFDYNSFINVFKLNPSIFEKTYQNTNTSRFQIRELNSKNQFQIIQTDSKPNLSKRKFTLKRVKNLNLNLKCPICDVSFTPFDLVFDDFMHVILKKVPKGIKMIEINEQDWIVTIIRDEKPYKGEEIISLEDFDDDDDDDDQKPSVKSSVSIIEENEIETYNSDPEFQEDDIDGFLEKLMKKTSKKKQKSFERIYSSDNDTDESVVSDEFSHLFNEGTADDPVLID